MQDWIVFCYMVAISTTSLGLVSWNSSGGKDIAVKAYFGGLSIEVEMITTRMTAYSHMKTVTAITQPCT